MLVVLLCVWRSGASTRSRRHTLTAGAPALSITESGGGLPRRGNRSSLRARAVTGESVAWPRALPDPDRGPGAGRPALGRVVRRGPGPPPHRLVRQPGDGPVRVDRAGDVP